MTPLSFSSSSRSIDYPPPIEIQSIKEQTEIEQIQHVVVRNEGPSSEEEVQLPQGPDIKTLFYENGNMYLGEMNDKGQPHGKGLLIYGNQKTDFLLSEANPLKPIHQTVYKKAKPYTTLKIFKKSYEGEFQNGIPEGQGKLIFVNGPLKSLEGKFKKGNAPGYIEEIKLVGHSHTFYAGQIDSLGNYQGKGWLLDGSSGHVYQGDFEAGLLHGKGKITYKTFDTSKDWGYYEGDCHRNLPHGKGLLIYSKGNQGRKLLYQGEFEHNCPQGLGTLVKNTMSGTCELKGLFEEGDFVSNSDLFHFRRLNELLCKYKKSLGEGVRIRRKRDDLRMDFLFIGRFDSKLSGVGAKISRKGEIQGEGIFSQGNLIKEQPLNSCLIYTEIQESGLKEENQHSTKDVEISSEKLEETENLYDSSDKKPPNSPQYEFVLNRFQGSEFLCPKKTILSFEGQYLHANRLGGGDISKRSFVVSQAPLKEKYEVFWQIVLTTQPLLFDLTKQGEVYSGLEPPYYPVWLYETVDFGNISVTLEEITRSSSSFVSAYLVSDGKKEVRIQRYHYLNWQEHTTISLSELKALIQNVEKYSIDMDGPLWVHCKAGLERSGCLVAALIIKEKVMSGEITLDNLYDNLDKLFVLLREQRGPNFLSMPRLVDFLREYALSLLVNED